MKSKWNIDPTHSEVNFKVKHLVISTVTGSFRKFNGTLETAGEADDFSDGKVHFEIDAASIDTNQADRDNHLRAHDFFNVEAFPSITFDSTAFRKKDEDTYSLEGDLTIRDITKPVSLDVDFGGTVTDNYGNYKAGFELSGKIKRKEFGLTWDAITEAGSVVLGDDIKLAISVQLAKEA